MNVQFSFSVHSTNLGLLINEMRIINGYYMITR